MTGTTLTIGEVARQTGMPSKTIRYYEEIRLIEPAARADNGYRVYDQRSVETLRFVKRARDLGFSIDEVSGLLALWRDTDRRSADVKALALDHIARVERKIAELQSLRRSLLHVAEHCHGDDRPDCPILDDLAGVPGDEPDAVSGGAPRAASGPRTGRAHPAAPPSTPAAPTEARRLRGRG
jgi:MerR family transcriptional regulator, copper efflux regulator